jgi:L-cysteine:1D-myo-inositol 2-amino-2-deoxy-alpha-D-glucopyranoside ligase
MQEHYSKDRMWTADVLQQAEAAVARIRVNLGKSEVAPGAKLLTQLALALADNVNTPLALLAIEGWCRESEEYPTVDDAGLVSRGLDSLLGLAL